MKKITICTVSIYDDDYENTRFHKFCMSTWERAKQNIIAQGFDCEIVIYGHDSEPVQTVMKECADHIEGSGQISVKADAVKLWIMANYPNHFYLDMDNYIRPNFEFVDERFFRNGFNVMYNGEDTESFQKVYDLYKNGEVIGLGDKKVYSLLYEENPSAYPNIIHCSFMDNYPVENWQFVDEDSDFIQAHYKDRPNYIFISKTADIPHILKLRGEQDLIDMAEDMYTNGKD